MKKLLCCLCVLLISFAYTNAQNIIAAEYFIDTDPGTGNGTSIPVTAGSTITFSAVIPTSSLSTGFHVVGIRVKNADNKWSLFETRGFYIGPSNQSASVIVAAEYFYDEDPGFGNGTAININEPGLQYKDSLVLPLGSLPMGSHTITIRVKNASGQWSLLQSRKFSVCTDFGPLSKMDYQVEYNKVFFTNLSTGADSTQWQFGDNTKDTVLNPIKTYSIPGNYTVKLITKNACGNDTLSTIININGMQRVNPSQAGNAGVATVVFEGNGFTANTILKLTKGTSAILPTDKQFLSSNRIIGYFDLNGIDTGFYDVIADLGVGSFDTLKNAMHITGSLETLVSISIGGRNSARFGMMTQFAELHNQGNQDAIMVPFTMTIPYVPEISGPRIALKEVNIDLTNKGIFANTYQYLQANNITTDVMSEVDRDSTRKSQMVAFYRLKIPAQSVVENVVKMNNDFDALSYTASAVVLPPLFTSKISTNDISSPFSDCMNSFLKKAVKRNMKITISDNGWNQCFTNAFNNIANTIRDMSKEASQLDDVVPVKAVFATLLAQMSQCGSNGLPSAIDGVTFQKIVKEVTYNWLFFENLDSIGRPCFDTTETVIFHSSQPKSASNKRSLKVSDDDDDDDICVVNPNFERAYPGLARDCRDFIKPCEQLDDLPDSKLVDKLSKPFKNWCLVNSGVQGCKKLCETYSQDPNAKYGPGNNATKKFINHLRDIEYAIAFENLASASAPAAFVEIADTLDKSTFDLSSFQARSFRWGDSVVMLDANRANYSVLKDLRPAHPNLLRIDTKLDTAKGIATWRFYTLDTTTLQLTDDPNQGFLPPNSDGIKGAGLVSFTIKPRSGVTSGTEINNKASIVFDNNAPIITTLWQHIIDTTLPSSKVQDLPANTPTQDFTVNWSGTDAHSGIDRYSVFVSVNDSVYVKWISSTSETSATFHGEYNKTYKFYSKAIDRAGNFEQRPNDPINHPDATTTLIDETTVHSIKDGLWSAPSTWSNNKVPGTINKVFVTHHVIVDIDAECESLDTSSPGLLQVDAGRKLTIRK